ncbi:MAG: ABC transporter ATP-binding protein, partial [Pseudomonadota bacterium]
GEIYGFLGRNGAGKSTALRIIMGITHADSGDTELFGQVAGKNDPAPRQHIGYVAQEQHFYDWMSALELGKFVSGFYPAWDKAEYSKLLRSLDLPTDRKIRGFSGGMTAKLALALALASKPRLLLLDEPTAGMDAVARREFLDIVREQAQRFGRTTLFSSHLIDEVELAADKVGILDDGSMRFEGSLSSLQRSARRFVMSADESEDFSQPIDFSGQVIRDEVRRGRREVTVQNLGDETDVTTPPAGWQIEQPTLEEIFIAMVSKTAAL